MFLEISAILCDPLLANHQCKQKDFYFVIFFRGAKVSKMQDEGLILQANKLQLQQLR